MKVRHGKNHVVRSHLPAPCSCTEIHPGAGSERGCRRQRPAA